jgi:hypothetical protein
VKKKLPQRTAKQNPFRKESMSDAVLVELLSDDNGVVGDEADFVGRCAQLLDAGALSKSDRDRLMHMARRHRLIGEDKKHRRPMPPARSYAATLADGCKGYDSLLESAQDALKHRPPMRLVGR